MQTKSALDGLGIAEPIRARTNECMTERELWIPTDATVTSCQYQFARLNTFRFGLQEGERFRITFDYHAHGRLYSDEFQSAKAIAQNEILTVTYNPLSPEENSLSDTGSLAAGGRRSPLIGIGIAGSVVLSLAWLAVLHGCH
jgi:hypothetical protein